MGGQMDRRWMDRLTGAGWTDGLEMDGQIDWRWMDRWTGDGSIAYPTVHESPLVQYEVVANLSLLYTVKGEDPTLTPYLLMAHLDVVPAEPEKWEADPFSADIIGDFVYARGTIDFKHGVMPMFTSLQGILEALNYYVSLGRAPERGFYVAFGHDEEVTGLDGAKAISEVLWKRGVRKVGVSEKGYMDLELRVVGSPGHSSMPPPESTIGILAAAVARLERNPLPSMLGYGPERETFEHLAPYINVNAPEATAYVNHRIHPAQSIQEIKVIASMDPHPIALSGEEDFGYQTVKNSIRQIWNNTYVAPGETESVTGLDGAKAISDMLWERGVRKFEFIVDEGLTVTNGIIPGMTSQTALAMSGKPVTNALIRTMTAVTMFNAGIKINVNAAEATAYMNHRIHPAQSIQEIKVIASVDPHPIAPSGEKTDLEQHM
ncbi:P2012-like protein [Mya arenaria]|uniref:P2012-like protein n=1 Tax=Mya arenaria TaxID=6604 RepID=A0ABY7FWZ6_MYAAR|nr:P2012-like protein [Mya arenaria]